MKQSVPMGPLQIYHPLLTFWLPYKGEALHENKAEQLNNWSRRPRVIRARLGNTRVFRLTPEGSVNYIYLVSVFFLTFKLVLSQSICLNYKIKNIIKRHYL